jgi:hypothetical protein
MFGKKKKPDALTMGRGYIDAYQAVDRVVSTWLHALGADSEPQYEVMDLRLLEEHEPKHERERPRAVYAASGYATHVGIPLRFTFKRIEIEWKAEREIGCKHARLVDVRITFKPTEKMWDSRFPMIFLEQASVVGGWSIEFMMPVSDGPLDDRLRRAQRARSAHKRRKRALRELAQAA